MSGRGALPWPQPVDAASWPELAGHLHAAHERLRRRPLADLLDVMDAVARLAADGHPLRRDAEAELPRHSGLSLPMARLAVDAAFAGLRRAALEARLRAEFPDLRALDGEAGGGAPGGPSLRNAHRDAPPGVRAVALGPRLSLVVAAGNVPVATLPTIVDLLLLRSAVACRTSAAEPVVPSLFLGLLREVDPEVAGALALVRWPREDEATWRRAFADADAVAIYGGEAAVAALRPLVSEGKRLAVYGPRLSAAHVAAAALADGRAAARAARALARDVALYDQHGCLSPQMAFVERGGAVGPRAFAAALARALARVERVLPRGPLPEGAAAAVLAARARAEFSGGAELWLPEDGGLAWTVTLEPWPPQPESRPGAAGAPAPALSPGFRTIALYEVDSLSDTLAALRPYAPRLSTLALAPDPPAWPALPLRELAELGVSRVTALGRMQAPPPVWPHDGRPNFGPFVEWLILEDPR
ncbi:MAG: hypothetical protein IRZ18_07155 [Clostridia bacterium]|nr:hypothetical protein [Clostridia bacterium]